jgi:hypothetical protein
VTDSQRTDCRRCRHYGGPWKHRQLFAVISGQRVRIAGPEENEPVEGLTTVTCGKNGGWVMPHDVPAGFCKDFEEKEAKWNG